MTDIRLYDASDFEGVRALWEEAFPNDPPWNRAELAIPEKLKVQPELFLVAETGGTVRRQALMPATDSTPRQAWRASSAVLPWRE